MSTEREIRTYQRYFPEFYIALEDKAQEKVDYAPMLLKKQHQISERFVKHLEDGNIVLLLNCFQKKSQKTPRSVIELAKRLKKEYYESKQRHPEF